MSKWVFNRRREVVLTERWLARVSSPRVHISLIVALTAATGFLASFALLSLGLNQLWVRYPTAVLFAYGTFLVLLWCWLRLRRDDLLEGLDLPISSSPGGGSAPQGPSTPWEPKGGQYGGGGSSGSFDDSAVPVQLTSDSDLGTSTASSMLPDIEIGDVGDVGDIGEAAVPVVLVVAVVAVVVSLAGAAIAAVWIVWGAPAFLAELVVDAALARGLYRRLRGVYGEHWLTTAVRRTFWPFVCLAFAAAVAGGFMGMYAPEARTLGEFLEHRKAGR